MTRYSFPGSTEASRTATALRRASGLASIATSRRRRRAKTDKIDGEALVRALLAHKRGEPRVCAMVRAPTPEEEDRRSLSRERKALTNERGSYVNRVKGLLFSQVVFGYESLRRDRREQLEQLKTGYGRPLSAHLKSQIGLELDRLELVLEQIKTFEAARDAMLAAAEAVSPAPATLSTVSYTLLRQGRPPRRRTFEIHLCPSERNGGVEGRDCALLTAARTASARSYAHNVTALRVLVALQHTNSANGVSLADHLMSRQMGLC